MLEYILKKPTLEKLILYDTHSRKFCTLFKQKKIFKYLEKWNNGSSKCYLKKLNKHDCYKNTSKYFKEFVSDKNVKIDNR